MWGVGVFIMVPQDQLNCPCLTINHDEVWNALKGEAIGRWGKKFEEGTSRRKKKDFGEEKRRRC